MLNNNKIKLIISLIIAIAIWGYVMAETNPIETKTIKDVPITYINEDVLSDAGLALLFKSSDDLSVTIEGNRSDVNSVYKSDIVATVDLADAEEGENVLRVVVHVPDSVKLSGLSTEKVTVATETVMEKEVPIVPEYMGTFDDESEPVTVEMSHDSVVVTGAKSLVESVREVKAVVLEGSVTGDLKTITCNLVPVNANGDIVNHVSLAYDTVNVTTEIAKTKTVPLDIQIVDNSGSTKQTSGPKTIVIKGLSADINKIESIMTETIDLTDVKENTVIDIVPILPDGVSISEQSTGSLLLVVTIPEIRSKKFEFTSDDIRISNLGKKLAAKIADGKFEVTVTGSDDLLDNISEDDIVLFVDLKGMTEGKHTLDISVTCDKPFEDISIEKGKVELTITPDVSETKPEDDPGNDDTDQSDDDNQDNSGDDSEDDSDDSEDSEG